MHSDPKSENPIKSQPLQRPKDNAVSLMSEYIGIQITTCVL